MGELLLPALGLAAWGIKMPRRPGQIASRQKCKLCGSTKYSLRDGWLWCAACGKYPATAFEIVLRWQGSTLRLGYDQQGRRLTSYPDAEAALALIRRELEAKAFEPRHWSSPQHNALLWDNYLPAHFARERARMTSASWRSTHPVIKHLAPAFAGHNLRDIRQGQVDDFVRSLTVAPSYQALICQHLARLFGAAVERQDLARAPRVPRPKIQRGKVDWLAPEAQALILRHLPDRHRPIFAFLFLYGCRPGEACALLWDCIDRREGVVVIRRTISADRLEDRTKTHRARYLPLGPQMEAILAQVPQGLPGAPVFQNRGRRYSHTTLTRAWRKALATSGLPHMPLKNGTRHSAGMRLVNLVEGGTVDDAAALLGHSTTAITTAFYARPEVARLRRLMEPGRVVNLLSIGKRVRVRGK